MVKLSLGSRIKQIRQEKDLKQQEFAKALGISSGYVSEMEQGNKMPGSEVLLSLKKVFHIDIDWLLTGEGAKEGVAEGPVSVVAEAVTAYGEDFVIVPQVRGEISAGGGLIPDDTIDIKVAFRKEWIQRRGDPRNMSLIRVSGDSMEPTLESGDIALVDHSRNYIDPQGGIYAIALDDNTIMIKRIHLLHPTDRVRIISDNNARYEPLETELDKLRINGKVIWFGREIER